MKKIKYLLFILFFILVLLLSMNTKVDVGAAESYPFNGIVTGDSLKVHSSNSLSSSTVTELVYGSKIQVQGTSGSLYKIKYDGNNIGYVSTNYIINMDTNKKTNNISNTDTYSGYCNSLKNKGFDETYCPYLYYLHSKYPKWTFTADRVGVTLDVASSNEEGKVVLETNNSNYYYNGKKIEGSYYYINASTIKSFMDPRNSLFDGLIFQFVDLEESKGIYNDAAIASSAGSGSFYYSYKNDFINASNAAGISVIHILARGTQEGTNRASFSGVTGTYTTDTGHYSAQNYSLDGYYNFFNIGAYADKNYPYTVQRGLAYAAGFLENASCISRNSNNVPYYDSNKCGALSYSRPWNTRPKAITGGIDFIANRYVKKGQDTLYFQKFNVSSYATTTRYANQYMTNAYAPTSEASLINKAYNAGNLKNSTFNFVIPVYNNMGSDSSEPNNHNSDTRLNSITVNGTVINGFDPDVLEYTYNVMTASNSFTIAATPKASSTKVTGTGTVNFNNNSAVVNIKTTAESGATATYKVTVNKVSSVLTVSQITSKMAVKISGNYMYGISPDVAVSTLIKTVTSNGGNANVVNASGKAKTSGVLATGDKITIKGTNDNKTFVIAVRGDASGDAKISIVDLLKVQKHILGKGNLSGAYMYGGDTNYDGKITIVDLLKIQKHILGKGNL